MSVSLAHQKPFRLGGLDVRPATREVIWSGGREVLQPRVMQVLVALAQARGEVVSRDDLIADCWDGRIVSEDAINFVVAQIRKLGQRTTDFRLETIPRVGLRLVAEEVSAPEAAPDPEPARRGPDRRVALATLAAVGLAAVAGGGVWAWRRWGRSADSAPVTIAVLPFNNLGAKRRTRPICRRG